MNNPSATPFPDKVPSIHFDADYDYWDISLMAKSDQTLVKDCMSVSPRIGITYAWLAQDFRTTAKTPEGLCFRDGRDDYRAYEELDTYYLGIAFGADLVFQVLEGITVTMGGEPSPLYSHTGMDLDYTGDFYDPSLNGKNDLSTGLSQRKRVHVSGER